MSIELINLWYVAAAALFIFGLKQLGSPATAVRGNTLSAMGMFIAIAVTLLNKNILPWEMDYWRYTDRRHYRCGGCAKS